MTGILRQQLEFTAQMLVVGLWVGAIVAIPGFLDLWNLSLWEMATISAALVIIFFAVTPFVLGLSDRVGAKGVSSNGVQG